MSTQTPSINDLLAGGAPSAKFTDTGTTYKGVIVKAETSQQTDFNTGKPKHYDDGNPMWQIVLTVQTEDRDPSINDDDGQRRIFVKGHMLAALKAALRSVQASTIDPGDLIAVQYTGDGQAKGNLNPPKQFAVQVKKGAGALASTPDEATPPPSDLL